MGEGRQHVQEATTGGVRCGAGLAPGRRGDKFTIEQVGAVAGQRLNPEEPSLPHFGP